MIWRARSLIFPAIFSNGHGKTWTLRARNENLFHAASFDGIVNSIGRTPFGN
jgi:hypothetical protein